MTVEQREAQILSQVHKLPILRRIRLALTILKEVEPNQIPVDEIEGESVPPTYKGEVELAERLLNRKESYLKGEGNTITRQELMANIYAKLASKS